MKRSPPTTHGGRRPGAGKPPGGGYGEPTRTVRVPESRMPAVVAYLQDVRRGKRLRGGGNAALLSPVGMDLPRLALALFESPRPQAGFPSPAADFIEDHIDLNELLIRNPPATFCVRIKGDSLVDLGLLEGDIVTVDRSLTPRPGSIVVAAYDGDIYIKKLRKLAGRLALCSENEKRKAEYPPLYLDQAQDHTVWGVVTGAVRKF